MEIYVSLFSCWGISMWWLTKTCVLATVLKLMCNLVAINKLIFLIRACYLCTQFSCQILCHFLLSQLIRFFTLLTKGCIIQITNLNVVPWASDLIIISCFQPPYTLTFWLCPAALVIKKKKKKNLKENNTSCKALLPLLIFLALLLLVN